MGETHIFQKFFPYRPWKPPISFGQMYNAFTKLWGRQPNSNSYHIPLWKHFLFVPTFLVQRRCGQSKWSGTVYMNDENTRKRHLKYNTSVVSTIQHRAHDICKWRLLYLLLIKVNERGSTELLVGVAQQSVRTTFSLLSALWIPTSISMSSLAETLKFFGIGEFPINNCISVLKCPDPCKSSKMV